MTQQLDKKRDSSFQLDRLVSNLRWLWLSLLAFFVVAERLLAETPSASFTRLILVIGIAFLLNGIYAGLMWGKFFPDWLAVATIIIDTGLSIALLFLIEHNQYLLPFVLFPVLIAGIRWNTEAGLLVAVAISAGYGWLLLVPLFQSESNRGEFAVALLTLSINTLTLVLAGTLPGFFMRQRIEIARSNDEVELEQLRIDTERGKLLSKMAITLSSTLNYHKVLRATIDTAFAAMAQVGIRDESAVAMVLLFEGERGQLKVAEGRNISRKDKGRSVSASEGLIGRTISTAEVVVTHRANRDKSVTSFMSTPGCKSAICAPLRAGFQTYGVILFCSPEPNLYTTEHKQLLSTFCSQAIIALQNAQLFEDVHREQQKILEKESEARRKLARDLHDGPTQSVAAIVMRLNFIKMVLEKGDVDKAHEEIVKVEEIAQHATHEIRTMLFAMRPVILETQGLMPALTQYAERLNANEPFTVSIVNRGYEGQLNQNEEAETVIFAIVEEAVGNAKKHAQATEIRVSLVAREEVLIVEIKDNGVGFDVEMTQSTYDQRTSLGLINMDERAEIVGGHCVLESKRGKGTTVRVEIPYDSRVPD